MATVASGVRSAFSTPSPNADQPDIGHEASVADVVAEPREPMRGAVGRGQSCEHSPPSRQLGALLLTLLFSLSGCSALPGAPAPELILKAQPTPGMRASYRVDSVATLSGPGARSLAESQKSASASLRYALEVGAIRDASFDVRVTGDHLEGVITGEFARDWTPLRFGVEQGGQYADMDLSTFPVLGESVQMLRDLAGRWHMRGTRPWRWTMRVPPHLEIALRGTVTLAKLTTVQARSAAEFHYDATGDGEYANAPVRLTLRGRCWVDIATGFTLETRTSSRGEFSRSGQPVHMEITEERRLDRSTSRGL
jgi:hypothetical protein